MAWKPARTGRFAASIGLVLAGGAAAHATPLTEVTSRVALGANDLLDWGVLHGDPQALPNPVTGISAGGLAVTLSTTSDRFINTYGTTHNSITDFAPTDNLIGTQQFTPIKLSFASAVFGAGLQVENQTGDQYGTTSIAATITAFNGTTLLGTFTEYFENLGGETGDAPFLGVSSTTADITSITYDLTLAATGGNVGILANQLSLLTELSSGGGGGGGGGGGTGMPEPATIALFGAGLLGLAAVRRHGQ